jgi:hypothetical protein
VVAHPDARFGGDVRESAPTLLSGALESSEMSECVQGYLAALPDDSRRILLHDVHGLSNPRSPSWG